MPAHDRLVAGIRCTEVLADLSDYIDHELPDPRVEQVEAHLLGCDWCERFGGRFSAAVAALRRELASAQAVPDGVRVRLRARLSCEMTSGPGHEESPRPAD